MVEFCKFIDVAHDVFEFRFTEVLNPSCDKYFVSVFDGQVPIVSFEIRKQSSNWEIVPPAPAWINEMEGKLNNILTIHSL